MHGHAKFHQNWPKGLDILRFFNFQDDRHPPSSIFKFLVAHQVGIHENQLYGYGDITFNGLQNGNHPAIQILKIFDYLNGL